VSGSRSAVVAALARVEGRKLLVVQVHDHTNAPTQQYVVAADSVQAGPGDMVLYATGSSARQTDLTEGRPIDASWTTTTLPDSVGGATVTSVAEAAEALVREPRPLVGDAPGRAVVAARPPDRLGEIAQIGG